MPKGHAVHHMLAFVFLWGAIDNARLNNFEHDHTLFVKTAVKRTRMHLKSMLRELEGATDRIMAVRYVRGLAAEWVSDGNVGCMVFFDVSIKNSDTSINLPQADGTNEEERSPPNHQNFLRGMRCSHAIKTRLEAAGMALTLENVSAVGTFHTDAAGQISTAGLTAAVKRLVPAAQGNWFITIASQVKLWAPQHHQDIGSATAHPNLWERSRFDTYIDL